MRKVSETPGMPRMAAGSSVLAGASDLPMLGSAHPVHDVGKALVGVLNLVGRRQISPCFIASEKHTDFLSKAFFFPPSPLDYHSIYIGVPVPRGYRRKRRRRRSTSSRDRTSESERHYERQDRSDTDDGGHGCYESGNDNASRSSESPAGFPRRPGGVSWHHLIQD